MKDKCSKIQGKLSAYLDGELTPDEMAEIAAHLEICPNCSVFLEKIRRIDEMAGSAMTDFDDELMGALEGRIMDGIEEPAGKRARPGSKAIPVWYRFVAAAASIIIVFLAGRMAFKELRGFRHSPSASYKMMAPAAEDTTMPYQQSETNSGATGVMESQEAAPLEEKSQMGGDKSTAGGERKDADQVSEQQAPARQVVGKSPTQESAADLDHQPKPAITAKASPELPVKKSEPRGKIEGQVVDGETGEPLSGVSVQIQGTTMGAKTNLDGRFAILSVPPDTYDLSYSSPGYQQLEYQRVPVYPGGTEELTVALSQAALESGKVSEVGGSRKGIDFMQSPPEQRESTGTDESAVAMAAESMSDKNTRVMAALPTADSLDAQYTSLIEQYQRRESEKGKMRIVQKLSASSQESVTFLNKIVDSLDNQIGGTEDPSDRITLSYLRLKAMLDLYRATGKPEYKADFERCTQDFERELSELEKQGYSPERLDEYRNRIRQMKLQP